MAKSDLQKRIDALITEHRGVRAAARVVDIDPSYLLRLKRGVTAAPGAKVLRKLGLERIEHYASIKG